MDIDVRIGQTQFVVRVAAVFLHEGHVLLHTSDADDLWCLPGGRARVGETSEAALLREMREEISAEIEVGPMQWVLETFFDYGGRHWHEIGLYHLAHFKAPAWYDLAQTYHGMEGETLGLHFRWVPISKVGEVNLVPRCLAGALQALPGPLTHIINDER